MLNTPYELATLTLKNRLVMAPMTTYSAVNQHHVTDEMLHYYKLRAQSVGMVIVEATAVSENGIAFENQLSIASDAFIPTMKKLVQVIHEGGAKAVIQLHHGGRMNDASLYSNKADIVAPSAIKAQRDFTTTPRAMTHAEVLQTQNDFIDAMKRAYEAGFDGVEFHGANTYLLQQFFSCLSNQRTDEFGCQSLENRSRFSLGIVKKAMQLKRTFERPFIIGYRISPEEIEPEGYSADDALKLMHLVDEEGVDYIHLSTGHYAQSSKREKDNPMPLIERLTQKPFKATLIGVGSVYDQNDCMEALKFPYGLIATGFSLIADPKWGDHVIQGKMPDLTVLKSSIPKPFHHRLVTKWKPFIEKEGRFIIEE